MGSNIEKKALKTFLDIVKTHSRGTNAALSRDAILNFITYRLPQTAKQDSFIGFREIKRTVFAPVTNDAVEIDQPAIAFDSSQNTMPLRLEYLQRLDFGSSNFVARNELISRRKLLGFSTRLLCYLNAIKWAYQCFLGRNRVNRALFLRSLIEFIVFSKICHINHVTKVFDFNQFEVDSNLFYTGLKQLFGDKIEYHKFPSPGPLELHNSILLADVVCYNTPYHIEEIRKYSETIRYEKLNRVPMEQFFNYQHCYQQENASFQPDFELAYYSHASWLRAKHEHSEDGLNIGIFEDRLLKCLAGYLKDHTALRLVIYTHPRERKDDVIEETNAFYGQYFQGNSRVMLCEKGATSSMEFMRAKLGIGVYSTILFERLACSWPTLIMSPTSNFPMPSSSLNGIIVSDDNFNAKLSDFLKLGKEEFFEKLGLEDYVEPLITEVS